MTYPLSTDVSYSAPHVVILGAGASYAACPNGDRTGTPLPLMNSLPDAVGFRDLLPDGHDRDDFESVYSELAADSDHADLCARLESMVYDYFADMALPDGATIYDYLVLSLRPKDVVATFNWDPFLVQAIQRSYRRGHRPPELLFLHGNVAVGACLKDRREGPTNQRCSECGEPFAPSRLLYPVDNKDYTSDPLIAEAWKTLQRALKGAFMVTVFGYSAPATDAAAKELLREAWDDPEDRELEQFEIIDIREEEDLLETWGPLIHTNHYEIHNDYHDSWIAAHPRRTGEAYYRQFIEGTWTETNAAPPGLSMQDLRERFWPLEAAEPT